jgi:hypothetical protein
MLWAEFLERIPPNVTEDIEDLFRWDDGSVKISNSDIQLYCDSDKCKGVRFFQFNYSNLASMGTATSTEAFASYYCRNCQSNPKIFALRLLRSDSTSMNGQAMKYGEFPSFGPPVPSRLISLIGPDREIFIRGRRAENQGLGIGAFAYYRRVIENQKSRLLTEISKVAKRLGASPEVLGKFDQALKETKFSKAVDDVKAAMPPVLLIDGHNPLTLLHSALSEGLHAGTDEDCLHLATSIRVVLTELSERISMALKEDTEIKAALTNLLNRNKGKNEAKDNEE